MPLPDPEHPRHVGQPPESMYDNYRRRTRSYGRFDSGRVEAVRHRIYVGEHRQPTRQGDGLGDFHVPERRHDDLVTESDACGPEHCSSTHARMVIAQRELQVTHNKKGLDPEPKFRIQPFE
jgi:hypothetical protein